MSDSNKNNRSEDSYKNLPPPLQAKYLRKLSGKTKSLFDEKTTEKKLAEWRHTTNKPFTLSGIAAANGRLEASGNGVGWHVNEQNQSLSFSWLGPEGEGFVVRMNLEAMIERKGIDFDGLDAIRRAANADTPIILAYLLALFVPEPLLTNPDYTPRVVDLGHIADAVGLGYSKVSASPGKSAADQRRAILRQVWHAILFGATCRVEGKQEFHEKGEKGKREKKHVQLYAPMFMLGADDLKDASLFRWEDAPTKVELTISREWFNATSGALCQYLPIGQLLAGIPGAQPTGAYARAMGLFWLPRWRMWPEKTLSGSLGDVSPLEIFNSFPPSKSCPNELENSEHRSRLIEYYSGGLRVLHREKIIAEHPDMNIEVLKTRLESQKKSRGLTEVLLLETAAPVYPHPESKAIEVLARVRDRKPLKWHENVPARGKGRPNKGQTEE